jgi:foldase protein PrsA
LIRRLSFMLLALALGVVLAGCTSASVDTSNGGASSTTSAATTGTTTATTTKTPTSTAKSTTTSETLSPGTVLAQVGSVAVTQELFAARLAQVVIQNPTQVPNKATKSDAYKDFERSVLESMVRLELVKQKAGALNVTVTDADVQNYIEQLLQKTYNGSQAKLEAALAGQKMTLAQYQTSVRNLLLLQKTYEQTTKDVPAPTDAAIKTYFDAHQTDYYQVETRDLRYILIKAAGAAAGSKTTPSGSTTTTAAPTEADWSAAKARAESISAEIAAGADFAQQAAKYSDDTGTKDLGGSIGTIKKGQAIAEFDAAAFSLGVEEISQPVKTSIGYNIIRVDKITPGRQLTLEEAKASVTTAVLNVAKMKTWEDWIAAGKTELSVSYREGMQTTTTTAGAQTTTISTQP